MISALYRYPKPLRRKVAAEWGRRSQAVQAAARLERGPSEETRRWWARHDARGQIVREGVTYFCDGRVVPWCVRRSVRGRIDQFDVVAAGQLWRTASARTVARLLGYSRRTFSSA